MRQVVMGQKVHVVSAGRYSQRQLIIDVESGLAWIRDKDGKVMQPSSEVVIHAGPMVIKKPIYLAAIRNGYIVTSG